MFEIFLSAPDIVAPCLQQPISSTNSSNVSNAIRTWGCFVNEELNTKNTSGISILET